jgi:CRISPR-associated endonuclease/helicase Cas3
MLLAKSADGTGRAETLLDHSRNVVEVARLLYRRLPAVVRSRDGLLPNLEAAAALHDIGKAALGFQEMVQGKRQNWNGWRHEVLSAGFASKLSVSEEVIFAVLTHHRQIPGRPHDGDRGRLRWVGNLPEDWPRLLADWEVNRNLATDLFRQLCEALGRCDLLNGFDGTIASIGLDSSWLDRNLMQRQHKSISVERRLRASLLRGLLMSADHFASGGRQEIPSTVDLRSFVPRFELRKFQKSCALVGNVILNAPTGSGKTEAALIWAGKNQPENGRFFYTLPYTAALNAMHGRLGREFSNQADSIGLLHGRAAHHLYEAAQQDYPSDPKKATDEAMARAHLAREGFYTVRVCTPHQLLRFTLRGRGWEQMLSEIPESCIVFDEVHSYDPSLAGLTLGTARLFASMGARLMFISATLPDFMRAYINELAPMVSVSPDPEDQSDREILERKRHLVSLVYGNLLDQVPRVVEAANHGRNVLVVCNHVGSAQRIAGVLRQMLGEEEEHVCLFHGRFNMRDRKDKERRLASGPLPKVLVATQVVEVSLDISFDLGFFEPAPIDALVQRMGRVNRQGKTAAHIFITRSPLNAHRLYDSERTLRTIELLGSAQGPLSEQDLKDIGDQVYCAGYIGDERRVFEERLNHTFLRNFEDEVIAGQHEPWIESVIEKNDGRADVLPVCLKPEYDRLADQKLWLHADALLVNTYTSSLASALDKKTDPWTVNLPYDQDGLHTRKAR